MIESTGTTANENKNAESLAESAQTVQTEGENNEVSELKKRIQELEAQVKEKENKYLYLYADFENFKKRTIKERSELIKFGWESVARELLQTLDNLERALAHIPSSTDKVLVEGLNMVLNQMKASLQKAGIQHIESLQKDFDPNLHEAVGQEPSEHPSGVIVKEHIRGYTLHGRLLRPARVIVSGGQAQGGGQPLPEAKSG